MKALRVERKITRFAAARIASAFGSGRGAGVGPLTYAEQDAPKAPGPGWSPVTPILSGICGSDLHTVDGRSSTYFEGIVSFPFVPGHEVVGRMAAAGTDAHGQPLEEGQRVVLQPVLGCAARGLTLCGACELGQVGRCGRLVQGHLKPGLQTGFCRDTGGGWSEGPLLAHSSQLFSVPDELSDEDAVTVEPMACAIHAALRCDIETTDVVVVIGAGTLGLGVVGAIGFLSGSGRAQRPAKLIVGARYPGQKQLARSLGADEVVDPGQLGRAVRLATRSELLAADVKAGQSSGVLAGGADVVVDCVGSADSIQEALSIVRPGGRVVLVGMPGRVGVDLAPLWHREVELVGAYAYGTELLDGEKAMTFDLALEMAGSLSTGRLVSARYRLDRYEEALAHAGQAGMRGAVKIVFDAGPKRAVTARED